MSNEVNTLEQRKLVGVLAQFDDPGSLLHACESARDDGIKKMDAYTPFPIHGIEKAIGIPRTFLPFIVLAVGLGAVALGIGLQWYTNATEQLGPIWSGYQFKISGKPYFSLPANIPVAFEIIVLSSAFAAFFGMLILNKLPRFANPLHRVPRFKRVTNDKFFLMIEAEDESFGVEEARTKLSDWGATDIEEVYEDLTDHQLPAFLKTFALLGAVMMLVPPVLIYRARGMTNTETRLHVVPDMDNQIKYKAQSFGPVKPGEQEFGENHYFFEHMRSAFAPIEGTVSRSDQSNDSHYFRGIKPGTNLHGSIGTPAKLASSTQEETPVAPEVVEPDWVTVFPSQIKIDEATVMRGQRQFNIYCAVCHGYSGDGDGLVNQRALALAANASATWTQAKSIYDETVTVQPVGRLFDTITHGRATMGPYESRVQVDDRWAIVLYLKALQETRKNALPDPKEVKKAEEAAAKEAEAKKAAAEAAPEG